MNDSNLPVPPVPAQFALIALLNKALFAHAAVKSCAAQLAQEEALLKTATTDLETAMMAANVRTLGSQLGDAVFVKKEVWQATDWQAVQAYVVAHDAFDVIQRRLSSTALRDRLSNGVEVPGTRKVALDDLKLNLV